jgi:hypothetical protein
VAVSSRDPERSGASRSKISGAATVTLIGSRRELTAAQAAARDDFGEPTPDPYGYFASASVGQFKTPRSASFTVQAGGRHAHTAWLGFAPSLQFVPYDVAVDPTLVTYPLFKAALLAINAIWKAPWACAQARRSGIVRVPIDLGGVQASRIDSVPLATDGPAFPKSIFQIPWIAYLSAELANGLKLAPEILTERTPDGGVLMSATTERFDPANLDHLRRARALVETLFERTGYSPDSPRTRVTRWGIV